MGCSPFAKYASVQYITVTAPNPDPKKWTLLDTATFPNGYVLKVRYSGCTNFEGVKVMVFKGTYAPKPSLDPHFHEGDDAPVARFRPDAWGWKAACALAASLEDPDL